MVITKGSVMHCSHQCDELPDAKTQDHMRDQVGHSHVGGLWDKLWPRKQSALKGDASSCSLKAASLKAWDQQQQEDKQLSDAEARRRWWAIATGAEAYSSAAASSSAATEDTSLSCSSSAASKQCSESNCTSSSKALSSSNASAAQQFNSSSCSSHPGPQLSSSSLSQTVAAAAAGGKVQLQPTIPEESSSVFPFSVWALENTSSVKFLNSTAGRRANTTTCSRQQPRFHSDNTSAARAFTAAYRRSRKGGKISNNSRTHDISHLSKKVSPADLEQLPPWPRYSERDLLKLKQLGRVEEDTLIACAEDLPLLAQDKTRAKVLGRGSYGTVYQLLVPWPNAAVAAEVAAAFPDGRFARGMPLVVKHVQYNPADPEWCGEMCKREETTCVAVNGSPWAPQLLWAGHTPSSSWFVYEELTPDPMNLDDYLAARPVLPTETIFHIIDQLGRALDDLHSQRGLVHNDLKPAQVCLPRRVLSAPRHGPAPLPNLYLVDYGISCPAGMPIIEHGFGGTLIYMDPELKMQALTRVGLIQDKLTGDLELQYKVRAHPSGEYSPKCDYFSLGQILAFILAKGNDSLHQKVVCLVAAAYAAGNTPELYRGVRALLCGHPSATKGLLDVLCALLGPQERRPGSYRELQKLLVRARMECRPEQESKHAWEGVQKLLQSGHFCHYDDEVLIGQMESSISSADAEAALAPAIAAGTQQEQCPEKQHHHEQQEQQQQQHYQQQHQQQRQRRRGRFRSFAQRLRNAKLSSNKAIKRLLIRLGAVMLPCIHPQVVHASQFMRPAATDSSLFLHKTAKSSSSSSGSRTTTRHSGTGKQMAVTKGCGSDTASSGSSSGSGGGFKCASGSLNSVSLEWRRKQLQQLLKQELQLGVVDSDHQHSKVCSDISDLEHFMFGAIGMESKVPCSSSGSIGLMSKAGSVRDLAAAAVSGGNQQMVLSDLEGVNLGGVNGSSIGDEGTDASLSLFDLLLLLPDQAVEQIMDIRDMIGWLLMQ